MHIRQQSDPHHLGFLQQQHGVTMLEVLVSLVLVSVAMLGIAGIQINALKYTMSSQFRTVAVILATDVSERIQANPVAAVAGGYAVAAGVATVSGTDCTAVGCDATQLASFDLKQWQAQVAAQLPQGSWSIANTTVGNTSTSTIVVTWVDRRDKTQYADTGTSETFSYTATKTVMANS